MSNLNKKIFDYLTEKENFETTIELIEKFEEVQVELIKNFWFDVNKSIKQRIEEEDIIDSKQWVFEFEFNEEKQLVELQTRHIKDKKYCCCYIFSADIEVGGNTKIGVYINAFKGMEFESGYLESQTAKLLEINWKVELDENKYKKNGWVISDDATKNNHQSYQYPDIYTLKSILPNTNEREKAVSFISNEYFEYFDSIIQTYILKTLKSNLIID